MLTGRVTDDGLEQRTIVEGPNEGCNCIHQLEILFFHIIGKQASRIRSSFKKSVVKFIGEASPNWPHLVE